jgi:hypothetical protein
LSAQIDQIYVILYRSTFEGCPYHIITFEVVSIARFDFIFCVVMLLT